MTELFPTAGVLRTLAAWLEIPTHLALLVLVALCLWELGVLIGERTRGLGLLRRAGSVERALHVARARIGRADLIARVGPMAGLMGTLIPLGPGLAALGRGDVRELASSVTVAFDTTVLGLAIGIVGFAASRLRRRWYDELLEQLEGAS